MSETSVIGVISTAHHSVQELLYLMEMHLSASSVCEDLQEFLNVFQNVQMGSALVPREVEVTSLQQCAREPKISQ